MGFIQTEKISLCTITINAAEQRMMNATKISCATLFPYCLLYRVMHVIMIACHMFCFAEWMLPGFYHFLHFNPFFKQTSCMGGLSLNDQLVCIYTLCGQFI